MEQKETERGRGERGEEGNGVRWEGGGMKEEGSGRNGR